VHYSAGGADGKPNGRAVGTDGRVAQGQTDFRYLGDSGSLREAAAGRAATLVVRGSSRQDWRSTIGTCTTQRGLNSEVLAA
jgi:hypothetical protein